MRHQSCWTSCQFQTAVSWGLTVLIVGCVLLAAECAPALVHAKATAYVEAFGGVNLPNQVGVGNLHVNPGPSRQSVIAGVYGVRGGAYGETFGAELEYLHATPHLKMRVGTTWPTQDKVLIPGWPVSLDTLSFLATTRYEWVFLKAGPHVVFGTINFDNCEDYPCGPRGASSYGTKTINPTLGWTLGGGLNVPLTAHWYASLTYEIQTTKLTVEGPGQFPASHGTPFNGAGETFNFMRQLVTVGIGRTF